jgi:glycosyltransferase involved in cell wall biosynthesis
VIPAHNAERYFGAALDSALAQTYEPLEIVIVDDGSTDGTAAAIAEYTTHSNVRTVRTENRGPSAARNRGAAEANGAFLAFLDADDVWMPERVARCIGYLDDHPAVGWVTTDRFVIEDDVVTTKHWYDEATKAAFSEPQAAAIAKENFVANGWVVRRELFDRFGGFDETLWRAEDYELWIRFILAGARAGFVDEALGWYRVREGSLSANREAEWESHLVVLERHMPALIANGARGRSIDNYAIARRLAARGDRQGAARWAMYAARADGVVATKRAVLVLAAARARLGAHL